MTTAQAFITVAVIAGATFLTRVIPFILFPGGRSVPGYIKYLGGVLPYAVIGMLIVYCLKDTAISARPYGIPEGIAVLFVVAAHKWKHNMLFSILGGTALYMILLRVF